MTTLIASQTPAEQLVMWTRFNTITEPLYLLLVKVEGLTAAPAASAASAAAPPPQ